MEKNRYTDAFKRAYNMDVVNKWIVPVEDYAQQVRLDMAANDLPDVFNVPSQYDLIQMANAGLIQEIGSLMSQYGDNVNLGIWEDGKAALVQMASANGKIYGLPASQPHTDFFSYMWIRKDWLEALNLRYPKTMDELASVMERFVAADFDGNGIKDTIGIAIDKTLYYTTRGIFSGFKAYPEIWVEKNGGLLWGGVDETNKAALIFLNGLYKKGLIDREFITYTSDDAHKAILTGKCGIILGGHWEIQALRDVQKLDPKADLVAPILPTADGKPVNYPIKPFNAGWMVVNAKYANPEVVYKMFTLTQFVNRIQDSSWWVLENGTTSKQFMPGLNSWDPLCNYDAWISILEVFKTNDESKLNTLGQMYWDSINSDFEWEWRHMFGPRSSVTPMAVLDEAITRKGLFYDAYLGAPSTYMEERWQRILDEQLVAFTRMIVGDVDVNSGFDAWVRTFNSMGGDRITREANDWYRNSK
jgi:putative aldouronate transport system substrate-binding protein